MAFLLYYLIYEDLDAQGLKNRSLFDSLLAWVSSDQNPDDAGVTDEGLLVEDLINDNCYEELFTETDEKIEEESLQVIQAEFETAGDFYDIKEIFHFFIWGFSSQRLINDKFFYFTMYENLFQKSQEIDRISKLFTKKNKKQLQHWFSTCPSIAPENHYGMMISYLLNSNSLDFILWLKNDYYNLKNLELLNYNSLDYYGGFFLFQPDPDICNLILDFSKKKNYFIMIQQDMVEIEDWEESEFSLVEPDINNIYLDEDRAHYLLFDLNYSVFLNNNLFFKKFKVKYQNKEKFKWLSQNKNKNLFIIFNFLKIFNFYYLYNKIK